MVRDGILIRGKRGDVHIGELVKMVPFGVASRLSAGVPPFSIYRKGDGQLFIWPLAI